MKKALLMLILFFVGCNSQAQEESIMQLKWNVDSVTNYGMFDVSEMKSVSEVELSVRNGNKITDERLSELFQSAKYKNKWVIWKGGQFAIVELKNGTSVRIAISNYGGFFRIVGEEGYYTLEGDNRSLWEIIFFGRSTEAK